MDNQLNGTSGIKMTRKAKDKAVEKLLIEKNAIFAILTEKRIVVQQYEMAVVHIATPGE